MADSNTGRSGSGQSGNPRRQGDGSRRAQPSAGKKAGARSTGKGRGKARHNGARAGGDRRGGGRQPTSGRRRAFSVDGGPENLPKWLREEIQRVTPRDRRDATLTLLSEAASEFADGQFASAHRKLVKAKEMSSRAAPIRELLGLTAYRMERWDEALRELRTFRRLAGDTTHMPVEIDALRGLRRPADVHKAWELFLELGGSPATDAEARVVYGSFLIDEGQPRAAWQVTKPKRLTKDAKPFERRRWYVAARAAALLGDIDTANQIARALDEADPDMVGLQELREEIDMAASRPADG